MIPVAYYRLISSNLTVIAGYFPLPGQIKQPQTDFSIIGGISLPLPVWIMAYLLTWLTLITIATGMYLMNGYELFKVPARSSLTKKQAKDYLFHLFPQSQAIFLPTILKIFSVSLCCCHRLCYGLERTVFYLCDLLIGQSGKIVKD